MRTPERHAKLNLWHAIVAVLLALLLLVLWIAGRGPGYAAVGGSCCGKPAPIAAAPAAAPAVAAVVDADGDGVSDDRDRCPGTAPGERVGEHGCPCDVTVQLQYQLDSAELTDADRAALDRVAAQLDALKFETGEVGGYADSTGDDQYNLTLSQRRAQSAIDYLVTKGIAAGRLTAVGYGEANPIADNATPEGRALNRRAVFRRVDCGPPPAAAAAPPSGASPATVPAANL
jgi:outer membrane protein OmpA-like peptidoglycan-associated protein